MALSGVLVGDLFNHGGRPAHSDFVTLQKLTDLNDFITPSQACIKPVESSGDTPPEPGSAATQIHIDASGAYYESSAQSGPSSTRKLQKAQINLNDCLACSGCITSAESVLITMQSHEEVFDILASNPPRYAPFHRIPILSISPQSLASLAAFVSAKTSRRVSMRQILRRIQRYAVKTLGFEYVLDTTFARHIALLEHVYEFEERRASCGTDIEYQLPMLASACPGWICYAEKTHSEMLPFISRTRSPQQVMGTLVKTWLANKITKRPNDIYHVTVMPCYDKKLEASRQDFYDDVYSTRDVDCVITTGELQLMLFEKDCDLTKPVDREADDPTDELFPELLTSPGSSSGSYLETLITRFSGPNTLTEVHATRSDYEEVTIKDVSTGRAIFRGAKCYGFRNLQNLVRKIGRDAGIQTTRGAAGRLVAGRTTRKAPRKVEEKGFDYVEVMACPSGCVNGGGQLGRPETSAQSSGEPTTRWGDKAWVEQVEASYWEEGATDDRRWRKADQLAVRILRDLCRPLDGSDSDRWGQAMDEEAERRRREYFRTSYRKVESEVIGLAVKW